jgi:hypothetical protein
MTSTALIAVALIGRRLTRRRYVDGQDLERAEPGCEVTAESFKVW